MRSRELYACVFVCVRVCVRFQKKKPSVGVLTRYGAKEVVLEAFSVHWSQRAFFVIAQGAEVCGALHTQLGHLPRNEDIANRT